MLSTRRTEMSFDKFAANGFGLGVCYFALQTFQALDKFYRQNNSTKPLLGISIFKQKGRN